MSETVLETMVKCKTSQSFIIIIYHLIYMSTCRNTRHTFIGLNFAELPKRIHKMFTFPIGSNTLVSRTSESVIKVTIFKLLHMLDHARVAVNETPVTVDGY